MAGELGMGLSTTDPGVTPTGSTPDVTLLAPATVNWEWALPIQKQLWHQLRHCENSALRLKSQRMPIYRIYRKDVITSYVVFLNKSSELSTDICTCFIRFHK